MEATQGSSTHGAAFGRACGEDDGGSVVPLWAQKVGEASSGFCNLKRQAWVHSCARWLPMDFLASEARRDVELHGHVVSMDSEEFRAHSLGFYKRADQWFGRHSTSQPRAPSPQPEDADMSKHVFATDSDGRDLTTSTTLEDDPELARGPSRPSSSAVVANDQPPSLQCGDVALWCERSAGGGQRFSTVLVIERAAVESTPGPTDVGTLSVTDGASTFAVDARDLRELEIPAALVPRLLSNARASPSRAPSPHPHTGTEGPWGWLSPAGLTTAVEDAVPVATHAVRHLVGKGGGTARLIEEICGVIVGVGDRGDGEAYVALFGPEQRVDAARAIVEAVARGAWSLPHRLKEHGYPIG